MPEINIASSVIERWDEKIAVIGGGPAGLSCAYYLATMGYYPTVFEKNEEGEWAYIVVEGYVNKSTIVFTSRSNLVEPKQNKPESK